MEKRSNKRLYFEDLKESKRKINVFITPLSGFFADCPICEDVSLGGKSFNKVYFPVRDVSYYSYFWKTNYPALLSKTNFMYLDYSSCVPYSDRTVDEISKPIIGK